MRYFVMGFVMGLSGSRSPSERLASYPASPLQDNLEGAETALSRTRRLPFEMEGVYLEHTPLAAFIISDSGF